MSLQALSTTRFVRKTRLDPNEYRKNFHQIDREVLAVITSAEADLVTPLMSKVYLRLVNAPERFWEREGVLRIEAEVKEEKLLKAWAVLCDLVGVASATASKAIRWMHEQGIIGYFSGKNGVGLRIFLNRAVSSIGVRAVSGGKNFLAFPPTSSDEVPGSFDEPAFNDSFAVREILDIDINSRAPKNGADDKTVDKTSSKPTAPTSTKSPSKVEPGAAQLRSTLGISLEEVVTRLKAELGPAMKTAAKQAASHEHERTREWLEKHGIPKATRVAQKEAYNVLRSHGLVTADAQRARAQLEVGRSSNSYAAPDARPRSPVEIVEIAETCVALLEAQGKSVEVTLSEISSEAGGWLLPEDAPRVRDAAHRLIAERGEGK
ncbi:MAG: hypothetical protein M3430_18475 [Acidobacteriota bacterium]|nr:hypothetical protein [Acidobacteriota bacterium]